MISLDGLWLVEVWLYMLGVVFWLHILGGGDKFSPNQIPKPEVVDNWNFTCG